MRKQTEQRLNQILEMLIIPESTKVKLTTLVEELEAEIESGLHKIHYLEKKSNALQNEYDMLSDDYRLLSDNYTELQEEVA